MARDVMYEELRPIVRESITEDTLRAIEGMVGLTPLVVDALKADIIQDDDPNLRQRAYTLVTKYTMGHPAIIKPQEEIGGSQMVVNFEMPRPDTNGQPPAIEHVQTIELENPDVRECEVCHATKDLTEFVAGSNRCVTCHNDFVQRAQKLIGKDSE